MTEASAEAAVSAVGRELAAEDADESQYLLHSRLDIAHVLRDIARAKALARVHFGSVGRTLLTPLLAVDNDLGELVFDRAGSEDTDHGILRAHKLLFYCVHDKVKVRFATGPARLIEGHAGAAFAVSLPASMLRLQRREHYRVLLPVARSITCTVPVDEQDGVRRVDARLHDLSQGGVALIAAPGELPPRPGALYPHCRIVLPECGNLIVGLKVNHIIELTLLNAKTVLKLGCEFVRPSASALALVQRYLFKLEREQRARS